MRTRRAGHQALGVVHVPEGVHAGQVDAGDARHVRTRADRQHQPVIGMPVAGSVAYTALRPVDGHDRQVVVGGKRRRIGHARRTEDVAGGHFAGQEQRQRHAVVRLPRLAAEQRHPRQRMQGIELLHQAQASRTAAHHHDARTRPFLSSVFAHVFQLPFRPICGHKKNAHLRPPRGDRLWTSLSQQVFSQRRRCRCRFCTCKSRTRCRLSIHDTVVANLAGLRKAVRAPPAGRP